MITATIPKSLSLFDALLKRPFILWTGKVVVDQWSASCFQSQRCAALILAWVYCLCGDSVEYEVIWSIFLSPYSHMKFHEIDLPSHVGIEMPRTSGGWVWVRTLLRTRFLSWKIIFLLCRIFSQVIHWISSKLVTGIQIYKIGSIFE